MKTKREIINEVISECFWGDYHLDAAEIEKKIIAQDDDFNVFFVGRIIREGGFPSACLNGLYTPGYLKALLDKIAVNPRSQRRLALVRAVLFGDVVEGLRQWPVK